MSRTARRAIVVGLTLTSLSVIAFADTATARPAAPAPATGSTYVVRSGDSLIRIASRHGVRVNDLLAVNGLRLDSLIWPGMTLKLPAGATPVTTAPRSTTAPTTTTPAASTSYTVRPGDSLIRIANRNGVRLNDLLSLNRLTTTSLIWPGMILQLPAGATPATTAPRNTTAPTTTTPAAAPAPTAGATYTVVRGDFLSGIASRFRVSLQELLTLNGLTPTSLILPGKVLRLPASAVVTPAPTTTTAPAAAPAPTSRVETVLAFARAQLGKPYKFFTAGPDTYDCSGLTRAAYLQVGISLPHHSGSQAKLGTAIDWKAEPIRPGDLVFLTRDGSEASPITHVGIATDATQWIHATRPGDVLRSGTIPQWRIVEVRRFITD